MNLTFTYLFQDVIGSYVLEDIPADEINFGSNWNALMQGQGLINGTSGINLQETYQNLTHIYKSI